MTVYLATSRATIRNISDVNVQNFEDKTPQNADLNKFEEL